MGQNSQENVGGEILGGGGAGGLQGKSWGGSDFLGEFLQGEKYFKTNFREDKIVAKLQDKTFSF